MINQVIHVETLHQNVNIFLHVYIYYTWRGMFFLSTTLELSPKDKTIDKRTLNPTPIDKRLQRSQHVTSWPWKHHKDLDRLCMPKNLLEHWIRDMWMT